ncbi:MAG TPA: 4Fe-4S dicluster domain-containing protein [Bacteroidota bacterium]|nr:4Fe-4S dicluster domain-containing protein [Bacteroidota bacterium]
MKLPAPPAVRTETTNSPPPMKTVTRRIKFESELDLSFGEHVAERAYGQKLLSCIQCGTCSATCPLSHYMDYTPRKIIAMTREGFKEEVLNSLTIWLCASCYSCTVQCPRQIHITDVMYALKREAIARGFYPAKHPIPVLARAFFNRVMHDGRNTESRLLITLYLRTNPFKMLKEAFLGFHLFRSGRLSLGREHIKGIKELRAMINGPEPRKEAVPL